MIWQMAVDLLPENLSGAKKVGHVVHTALLPMVGNAPPPQQQQLGGSSDGPATLVTAGEVYVVKGEGLVVVQLRSPLARSGRSAFRDALVLWLGAIKAKRVVVLTGADASERVESQLSGSQLRCVLSDALQSNADALKQLACPTLEPRTKTAAAPDGLYVHGGGISRRVFHDCVAQGLAACVLVHFCNAGDNQQEAHALVQLLAGWLKFKSAPTEWTVPTSWALSFAPRPPPGLY
jgi:proteasome assembly chaperone 2